MGVSNEQLLAAVQKAEGMAGACLVVLLVALLGIGLVLLFQIILGVIQIKQANYAAALLTATRSFGHINEQRRDDAKQALSRIEDKVERVVAPAVEMVAKAASKAEGG